MGKKAVSAEYRESDQATIYGGQSLKRKYIGPVTLSNSELENADPFLHAQQPVLAELVREISMPTDQQIFELYHGNLVHMLICLARSVFRAQNDQEHDGKPHTLLDYAGVMDPDRLALQKWITEYTYTHLGLRDPTEITWKAFELLRKAQEFRVYDKPTSSKRRLMYPLNFPTGLREEIWHDKEITRELEKLLARYAAAAHAGKLRELEVTEIYAAYEQSRQHRIVFSNGVLAVVMMTSDALYLDQTHGIIDADLKQNEGKSIAEMSLAQRLQLTLRYVTAPFAIHRLRQISNGLQAVKEKDYKRDKFQRDIDDRALRAVPRIQLEVDSRLKIDFPEYYDDALEEDLDPKRIPVSIRNQYPGYDGPNGFYSEKLTPDENQLEIDLYNLQRVYTMLAANNGEIQNQVRQYIDAKKNRQKGLTPRPSLDALLHPPTSKYFQKTAFLPHQPSIYVMPPQWKRRKKKAVDA